ncbi:SUKH-4 family immunity protein [Streptomyces sp. NPDC016845]|uniref:SUKH-4 family immunity protein n=1 Tax=Streptomyces sp. NPDC016845 TaxID=3364972 RepID=UPI0037AC1732
MLSNISPQTLIDAFGIDHVAYYATPERSRLHEGTGRFLATTGLPISRWFSPLDDLEGREQITDEPSLKALFEEVGDALPQGCEDWEVLGEFLYSVMAIDPSSGKVYEFPEGEEEFHLIHADVSSLVHALIVLQEAERDFKSVSDRPDYEVHAAITEQMKADIVAVDPTPFANEATCWSRLLEEIATGMWG